jgi:hypothetical protein
VEFGPRGSALWEFLGQSSEFSSAGVLAVEACRLADRLDKLDEVIAGKGVLQLMHFRSMFEDDDERHLTMTVDHVLAEARQYALALQRVLESPALKRPEAVKGASPIDALAARRTARRAEASGPLGS